MTSRTVMSGRGRNTDRRILTLRGGIPIVTRMLLLPVITQKLNPRALASFVWSVYRAARRLCRLRSRAWARLEGRYSGPIGGRYSGWSVFRALPIGARAMRGTARRQCSVGYGSCTSAGPMCWLSDTTYAA